MVQRGELFLTLCVGGVVLPQSLSKTLRLTEACEATQTLCTSSTLFNRKAIGFASQLT